MEQKNEIWIPIKDTNGKYSVSNLGRIVNNDSGKIRKLCYDQKGYLRVRLSVNGDMRPFKVHRVVAICFIENPYNKREVNHINGIKDQNNVSNLEWVTSSENAKHAHLTGLNKISDYQKEVARKTLTSNSYSSKKIINKKTGEVFNDIKSAAASIGLKRSSLSNMLTGFRKNWTNFDYL